MRRGEVRKEPYGRRHHSLKEEEENAVRYLKVKAGQAVGTLPSFAEKATISFLRQLNVSSP